MSRDPNVERLLKTFSDAEVQYRSTGSSQFKPAADAARAAVEDYIGKLEDQVRTRQAQFDDMVKTRGAAGGDLDRIIKTTQKVRNESSAIASDYLVASSYNDPTPVDWSKYHIKLSVIVGLASGIIIVSLFSAS